MITISLCMIVRDEEATIGRCLDTVKDIVDEIIIIDTGSIDETKNIVKQYTDYIYDYQWIDDFSAARNYSFSKATMDYILWLDADDILKKQDRKKLKMLKAQLDPSIDIAMMKYNLETNEDERVLCTYYRARLLKRSQNYKWNDAVHEYIKPTGKIIMQDIAITHKKIKEHSSRNLDIFQTIIEKGNSLSHRNCFYYARELYINKITEKAKIYYEKYLEEEGGYFSNYMEACINLSKIYTKDNDRKRAIKVLFRCFEFGMPRAEICFEIGSQYKELQQYKRAITWFELATKIKKPENTMGVVLHDYYDYYPLVEISICYFRLNKIDLAIEYNEKASKYKPESFVIINNRKFFEEFKENENINQTI